MRIIYNLLVYIVILLSPLIIIYRILKKKENPKRFLEKFSINKGKKSSGKLIWFHCSSVGEFLSIVPLIHEFERKKSVKQILVTTSTLSSSKIFEKFEFKKTVHQFYPLDNIFIINNFLNHWKPSSAVFAESEIWPTMISELKKREIKIVLINARMTEKTFKKWFSIKSFGKKILEEFDYIFPQNKETFLYYKKLGIKKLRFLGNLKFISSPNDKLKKIKKEIFKNKNILCSASTHYNEEEIFANLHIKLKKKIPRLITIIIPRHIERTNEIIRMLDNKDLNYVKHSENKKTKDCDIYIVDSYGESKSFYKISNVVFLGGSLVSKGGQNPLEALRFGCNIIHGNYTFNFKDVYKMLEKEKLSLKVSNGKDLEKKALNLFKNKKNNSSKIEKLKKIGNLILRKNLNELERIIL
tara:strand:- start:1885 stop:3120 length:1236 start_codon:yes stop_codon:yes gene_type:complete